VPQSGFQFRGIVYAAGRPGGNHTYGRHYVVRKFLTAIALSRQGSTQPLFCDELRRLMTLMHEKETVPDRDSIVFLDTELRDAGSRNGSVYGGDGSISRATIFMSCSTSYGT
jgi:hypothetical protein